MMGSENSDDEDSDDEHSLRLLWLACKVQTLKLSRIAYLHRS